MTIEKVVFAGSKSTHNQRQVPKGNQFSLCVYVRIILNSSKLCVFYEYLLKLCTRGVENWILLGIV
jgi:hypothetical protein